MLADVSDDQSSPEGACSEASDKKTRKNYRPDSSLESTEDNIRIDGQAAKILESYEDEDANISVTRSLVIGSDRPKVDGQADVKKNAFDAKSRAVFEEKYQQMVNSNKLKLKSGRFVEDVISIHSFIYVHDDPNFNGIFTANEEDELQRLNLKETTRAYTPKGTFSGFFKKFVTINDLDELRAVLFSGPPELTNEDDPEFWICQIGEKSGLAGQERKDMSRTLPGLESLSSRNTGKKGDGYIRIFGSAARDVGAMEAGPKWEGPKGTKCFFESGLMPKILRDILWSYSKKSGHHAEILKQLVIPGVLVYGEGFKRVKLDSIGGYVTRIRSSQWKTLNLSGGVKALTDIFLDIYRLLVLQNEAILNQVDSKEDDPDDFLERLHEQSVLGKSSVCTMDIGLSQPTPRKK
ncbi:hypothetical protein HK100_002910 [Physocladia obscura]|uniref:Uncharacterized protein n=1 Tax=Physocladia obscura TaxID=109957 RepID=A0AAD5T0P0_9FUNG|nr:hypothetical protein HK100_002910 [Physocladia obscura]